MKLTQLKQHKKILIVGRGVEGQAVERYLTKHMPEKTIVTVDQEDGKEYLANQSEFDLAIKSPGVLPELITIPYTTATNIFLENAKGKIIGVTGSKGKSTTTTLIYEMLKKQGYNAYLGGNIGHSPLDFLDILNEHSWTALEMSSFQLQDATKSPHIAVILMIAFEHLDYHKTPEGYVAAKRNIVKFQQPTDYAILNRDYPQTLESDIHRLGKVFLVSRDGK